MEPGLSYRNRLFRANRLSYFVVSECSRFSTRLHARCHSARVM